MSRSAHSAESTFANGLVEIVVVLDVVGVLEVKILLGDFYALALWGNEGASVV